MNYTIHFCENKKILVWPYKSFHLLSLLLPQQSIIFQNFFDYCLHSTTKGLHGSAKKLLVTGNRSAAVCGWMDGWHLFAWLTTFVFVFVSFICQFSFTTANYFLIIMAVDPRLGNCERGAAAPVYAAVNVNHGDLDRAAVLHMIKRGRSPVER